MPVSIKKKYSPAKPRRGKLVWPAIRDEWVALKASGSTMSLREFGEKRGIAYQHIRIKSAEDKWADAVKARVEDMQVRVTEQLVQRSAEAISSVRQSLASDEMEVRERHARISRGMQAKAISRLNSIPVDSLTAREAIDLLRIGLEQERKALGIPDEHHVQMNGHVTVSREQEIFEQHLLVHKNVQKAVGDALLLLEDKSDAG